MEYVVRPAGIADIPSIQRIAEAVWPLAYGDILPPEQLRYMLELFYSADALTEQMQEKGHQFLLAADDLDAVGFASYSLRGATAHLHKLYVLPHTQGSGVGAVLLTHCETSVADDGAVEMQLNVNRHNKAKGFYERQGYEVILEEDIDIGRGFFMNDYRMEKRLRSAARV